MFSVSVVNNLFIIVEKVVKLDRGQQLKKK